MSTGTKRRGRVAVIGAGPAGMATALSIHQAGFEVALFERYPHARAAGNILNLWPAPIKALGLMGVDIDDLGAACKSVFKRMDGRVRATVDLPRDVVESYGGGFIGLLRPELYERLLSALPPGVLNVDHQVESFEQNEAGVTLRLSGGRTYEADLVVGADGIDSLVRRTLWGNTPKREHNLHVIGGFTFDESVLAERGLCVVSHGKTVQGSWGDTRNKGRDAYQWWVVEKFDASTEFRGDLKETATRLAADFADPLPQLIAATDRENFQRWVIRDRKPLPQWSKGRATLVGDAAHPTSPYSGYGAGMSIEDGYFLGRRLAGLDLTDYSQIRHALDEFENPRKPHTSLQSQTAYYMGRTFHHCPAMLRPVRDFVLDRTPLMQKVVGEKTPGEILKQIDEIDNAEKDFTKALRNSL